MHAGTFNKMSVNRLIDAPTLMSYMKHFIKNGTQSKENVALLILDVDIDTVDTHTKEN